MEEEQSQVPQIVREAMFLDRSHLNLRISIAIYVLNPKRIP